MTLIWAGSYTENMGGFSRGISALRLNDRKLQAFGFSAVASSPSFLAHSSVPGVLYATDEAQGRVEAFNRKGKSSTLVAFGGQATSGGKPCHLTATQEWLYVCNYADGSIDVFPLDAEGRIGALAQTMRSTGKGPKPEQECPHAHSTLVFGDTVVSADLGTDRVNVYHWNDQTLSLSSSIDFPPGTGPRDLVASPVAGKIFLIGELSPTVFVLGGGRNVQVLKAAHIPATAGDKASGLAVDSSGRFLYVGLRGSNRLITIDSSTLEPISDVSSGGDWPRSVCVIGEFLLVANQRSGTVSTFRVDGETGIPTMMGNPLLLDSPAHLLPELP